MSYFPDNNNNNNNNSFILFCVQESLVRINVNEGNTVHLFSTSQVKVRLSQLSFTCINYIRGATEEGCRETQ